MMNRKKLDKEKFNRNATVAVIFLACFAIGYCLGYSFKKLNQHKKQQSKQEYLDSIHNQGYVTDSVYNILKQNTK